ncbi:MAG: signal peptidase I [Coriobacteriia bacterium]
MTEPDHSIDMPEDESVDDDTVLDTVETDFGFEWDLDPSDPADPDEESDDADDEFEWDLDPSDPAYLDEEWDYLADDGEEPVEEGPPTEEPVSFLRWLVELVALVGLAFALSMGIRTFLIDTRIVPTGSMEPTIHVGDRLLVNRFDTRFSPPERGDVIVFKSWTQGQPDLVKRVIALGGETVAMDTQGRFTIDGMPLDEPYIINSNRLTDPGGLLPYTVPQGCLFMMGDNRNNSSDSRFNGPVPLSAVLGRAFAVYWPPSHWRTY